MHRSSSAARWICRLVALVALGTAAACDGISTTGRSGEAPATLLRAEAYTQHLLTSQPEALEDAEVIALGYMERLRLGLGSPFRLIEYALRDPDLSPVQREQVAMALLSQTLRGRIYEVDARVMGLVQLEGVSPGVATGVRQIRLIERIVQAAPSAESGERIVRLGYRLATAERTVEGVRQSVVAHVAAMVADRRRARADAQALLREAERAGVSPLELIPSWRAALRFQVESPALVSLSVREEEVIANQGPRFALALRALAQQLGAPGVLGLDPAAAQGDRSASFLRAETAERLWELANRRDQAPQAPIAVALLINRATYVEAPGLSDSTRAVRARFADGAWNEERFVAGVRLQQVDSAGAGARLPLIELQAAVFFRVWNQEEPWFPGDPAPAVKDLIARFGLARVEFGDTVRDSWKPYYLRMLGRSLADLQRVLPTASVRGLTIRIDDLPGDRKALALHDPKARTLYLPPRTGGGTLAHEIAHDLDWQLARSRYGSRGGYATDLAVNHRPGDRIASALAGLARSLTQPDSNSSAHDVRPAEVFARGTDWFVAAVMAREGRTGGYLTSFQDPVLTGYGSTRGPDVGGEAVSSLLNILEGVAPVARERREWAVDAYGPHRMLTPAELAGAIVHAGRGMEPVARFEAIAAARDRSRAVVDNSVCRLSSAEGLRRLIAAQRGLVQASAAAAARGAAIDGARRLAGEAGLREGLADQWMAWRFYGAPEPADSTLRQLDPSLELLVYQAQRVVEERPIELGGAFVLSSSAPLCGGNPFASVAWQRRLRGPGIGLARTP